MKGPPASSPAARRNAPQWQAAPRASPAAAKAPPRPAGAAPPPAAGTASPEKPDLKDEKIAAIPHLAQVLEVIRTFIIAEKTYRLYPVQGRVARQAVQGFYDALQAYFEEAHNALNLRINQTAFYFGQQEVYQELQRAKSLAYHLYKDGVRWLIFLEEVAPAEVDALLACYKESAKAESDEDDFGTLFWERDCTHIQLQLIDETEKQDDECTVVAPSAHLFSLGFNRERFAVSEQEEDRLRQELIQRQRKEVKGEDSFELTEAEIESIRKLARSEEDYFAVFDFVDVLIEHMSGNPDPKAFEEAAKMIRSITFALVETLDFEHAAHLLGKLSLQPHPALTDAQRRRVRELVGSFCDKETLQVLSLFLKENTKLPKAHAVFKFMRLFTRDAVPYFCEFLSYHEQIPALCHVLTHIGKGCGTTFSRYLLSSDPLVARAMISVILQTEPIAAALERLSAVLRHPDENVRKTAAKAMLEDGSEAVGTAFLPLLEDAPLAGIALQFFAKAAFPAAYENLVKLTRSKLFQKLDPARQLLCFKAMILADPDRSIDYIANKVLRWTFAWTQGLRRLKSAALRALQYHRSEKGREVLARFSVLKRNPLAPVAEQVLHNLERGAPPPAARTEEASPGADAQEPAAPVQETVAPDEEVQGG